MTNAEWQKKEENGTHSCRLSLREQLQIIMKMPSQTLNWPNWQSGNLTVWGDGSTQKSKSPKIKSDLFAKTPKTFGYGVGVSVAAVWVRSGCSNSKCETHAQTSASQRDIYK